jgi:hypothetical protein
VIYVKPYEKRNDDENKDNRIRVLLESVKFVVQTAIATVVGTAVGLSVFYIITKK